MARLRRLIINMGLSLLRTYWSLVNPISVGVRAIVRDHDGQVLLVRHIYGDDRLHLPGGGIKRRETLVDGLRRELREETGLEILAADDELRLLGVFTNFHEGKSDHVSVFVIDPEQWKGDLVADEIEIAKLNFESHPDLPEDVSPGTARRLAEFRGERPITFEW